MNKICKLFFGGLIFLIGCLSLTSCGTPLDTTIDEINKRYIDHNPMSEEEVLVRFGEPLKKVQINDNVYIGIWIPNYQDLDIAKQDLEQGKKVNGVLIKFEKTTRSFQRLNEETLEMEWYEKTVIDAIQAEKRALQVNDLK